MPRSSFWNDSTRGSRTGRNSKSPAATADPSGWRSKVNESQASATSSPSPPPLASEALQADSAPQLLAQLFPPLHQYCPILPTVSNQQTLWLLLDDREAFYGGAAGGGKSAALLMAALRHVDTAGYAALLLRRSFPQLSQPGMLIPLSQQWLGGTDAEWNGSRSEWSFPSGAVIRFGHVQDEQAVFNYQGGAYQFVGFDELTQFTPAMYEYISFSRARRDLALEAAGVTVQIRSTANPGGVGHQWVKQRFVDVDTRTTGAVFIPAKVADNPGLDVVDYTESLSHLGDILRRQLLDGDWGAFEGAAYPDFDPHLHLVDPFDVPDPWERFESVDPGSTNPCAWLAWAVDYDGNHLTFDELYVEEPTPHLPSDIVPLLQARRAVWWPEKSRPVALADPAAFAAGPQTKWGRPPSFADEFAAVNVPLVKANNDRVAGYVRLAQLLRPDPDHPFPAWHPRAGEMGSPRWFITRACPNLIEQVQGAPLEELGEPHPGEAVSRKWEGPWGHAHAAARYGALSWPGPSTEPEKPLDDPRAEMLRQYMKRRDLKAGSRPNYEFV